MAGGGEAGRRGGGGRLVRELVAQPELGRVGAGPGAGRQRRRRCGKRAVSGAGGRGGARGLLTEQLVLGVGGGRGRGGGRLLRARLRLRLEQLAHGVARRGGRALQRPAVHGRRVPLQHVAALEALGAEGAAEQAPARLRRGLRRRLARALVHLAVRQHVVPAQGSVSAGGRRGGAGGGGALTARRSASRRRRTRGASRRSGSACAA